MITLPWRVGARTVELAWRVTSEVVDRATGLVTDTFGHAPPRDQDLEETPAGPAAEAPTVEDSGPADAPTAPAEPEPPPAPTEPEPPPAPTEPEPPPATAPPSPAPAAPEPSVTGARSAPPEPAAQPESLADLDSPGGGHVSEERVLVEEVAEPGAEDGAGAQITIEEPWDGYRLTNAGAIIDRLPGATSAELATIELYELANRKRQTVLEAAQAELKRRG